LPEKEALRDPEIRRLHDTWISQYEDRVSETWAQVQAALVRAAGPIEVRKVNSKSPDKLDYRRYKNEGLHVIAVGGFALSRGFTLEGLTVSYFLRNSMMYDTLLQMGRWFGYRDGYSDVCRIYMTEEAIDWYAHISEAIDELRDEFNRMERIDARPVDFGLKVRAHPESLIVTARNKMKSGRAVNCEVSLAGQLIETTKLRVASLEANRLALNDFLYQLDAIKAHEYAQGTGYLWRSTPAANLVRDFIEKFRNFDEECQITQSGPVNMYIRERESDELSLWDVCLYSPSNGNKSVRTFGGLQPVKQERGSIRKKPSDGKEYISVSGNSSRVGSPGQAKAGMTEDQIFLAKEEWTKEHGQLTIPDKHYLRHRRTPLLMIHILDIKEKDEHKNESITEKDVVAWGIGFPSKTNYQSSEVNYIVNTTWWAENYGAPEDDTDED